MNNKIPCGGFELDDSLTLDSEKKLGVNWEGQVQSDWSQNNENAPDYIKNRLCYEEIGTVYITWNGYTGGHIGQAYNQSEAFWKMSDNIYTKEELIGQSFTFYDGNYQSFTTVEITEDRISDDIAIKNWLDGVEGFIISSVDNSPKIVIITEVTSSATLTPGLYFSGSNSQNSHSHDYVSNMTANGVVVHQLDSKYIPGTAYLVTVYTNDEGKYIADKSFNDIKTAIDDGKYVCVYYVDEDEFYQLTDKRGNLLSFSRATPYSIKGFDINDSNKIEYQESDLDGSKNWLLSFNEKGRTTPVESLDYIKLKSPNGTLYTISVTDDGTIQAQVKP